MSQRDVTFPHNEAEERICALWMAIACVNPDEGCKPDDLMRIAETLLRYIRYGEATKPAMVVVK